MLHTTITVSLHFRKLQGFTYQLETDCNSTTLPFTPLPIYIDSQFTKHVEINNQLFQIGVDVSYDKITQKKNRRQFWNMNFLDRLVLQLQCLCLKGCLQLLCLLAFFGFLTHSSASRLYRGRVPRLTSDNCTCRYTEIDWYTMTSVSFSHIVLTPTQPEGNRRPKRGSNP